MRTVMMHWSMCNLHRVVVDIVWLNIQLERDVLYKKKNAKDKNFLETLQLARNRELLQKFIKHEIIQINNLAV